MLRATTPASREVITISATGEGLSFNCYRDFGDHDLLRGSDQLFWSDLMATAYWMVTQRNNAAARSSSPLPLDIRLKVQSASINCRKEYQIDGLADAVTDPAEANSGSPPGSNRKPMADARRDSGRETSFGKSQGSELPSGRKANQSPGRREPLSSSHSSTIAHLLRQFEMTFTTRQALAKHPQNVTTQVNDQADTNKSWAASLSHPRRPNVHTRVMPDGIIQADCQGIFSPENSENQAQVHSPAREGRIRTWNLTSESDVEHWFNHEIAGPVLD
ncbi:hypothetical protein CDD80_5166 [Ophiocordyceps camponoti-rufipedis]|uniref:Uncharacterized protein n=1 Tax=Ophiocordyceps camponoti-rufipedis TaxID=2004952 RepID=A0A2C5ZLQ5_9HYPO|nr:hypothetical protein CDD80_5166 [Ophiocordyceps camponoti-rufipedis]